jgi:hypothetical protein
MYNDQEHSCECQHRIVVDARKVDPFGVDTHKQGANADAREVNPLPVPVGIDGHKWVCVTESHTNGRLLPVEYTNKVETRAVCGHFTSR